MDAKFYNGEPGAMSYDRDWNMGREREPEPPACRDCGDPVLIHGTGTPAGTYCFGCAAWRQSHGLIFDARTRLQIESQMRKGAA